MIKLTVPGTLQYRDVAVRVVAATCKLLRQEREAAPADAAAEGASSEDTSGEDFDAQVISAFQEAFNNVAIHGYDENDAGDLEITIDANAATLTLGMADTGRSYELPDEVEAPDSLPERGMGLFIMRSFMDEVTYEPGDPAANRPNRLTMIKAWPDSVQRTGAPADDNAVEYGA